MKILYKLTSRSRPLKMLRTIRSIYNNAIMDDYHIHCTLDEDDITTNTPAVIELLETSDHLSFRFGTSKNKVDAINRDMDTISYNWDILVNVSDDMLFVKHGFDEIIVSDFIHCADIHGRLDTVLHYDDGNKYKSDLMTMSIIGREYFKRDNYIYCPDYISLWCDDEAMDVAKIRGKYKYMGDNNILFNHLHPMHVKGIIADAQARYTDSFYQQDKKTYERRKLNNFNLK